jgi:peptidoglycan hydrolase-like protein with peptidoglycan-binding domain
MSRARVAIAALVLAAAGVAAVVLLSSSPARKASATGLPPGQTTSVVTRRTLSESSTVDGTLGYGGALQLYDRLAGTFTWLPAVGAVIGRGDTLYRVDNLPVVLMYGSVPAYRALKLGVGDGPDVAELNRNLSELGFDPSGAIGEDSHFGGATAAAVRRWQSARGLAQSGEVPLGRIVFAPGARRITAVHVALGQDPPGEAASDAPAATTPAATTPATTPAATTPATTPTATTPAATTPTSGKAPAKAPAQRRKPRNGGKARKGAKKPAKAPAAKSPAARSPAKASAKEAEAEASSKSPSGGKDPSAGAGELVLSTTSTRQLVQLAVKAEQQQLARVGESAPVTLPGGEVVRGHITDVGTVASESQEEEKSPGAEKGGGGGGGGESATIAVTVALDRRVARLDQAPVSVELLKEVRRHVLTVPATALTATAGGGYAVEVLEGGRRRQLAVTPGMFADGYVQIEGPGVRAGLIVTESQ